MNTTSRSWLRPAGTFLLFLLLLLIATIAAHAESERRKPKKHRTKHSFWFVREKNVRGIERYRYNRPHWPYEHGCSGYYTRQPIKHSTLRTLHFSRKNRG